MPDENRPLIAPAAHPVPENGPRRRRDRGVIGSSLDIVFSYSRSQQLFFGSHLPSAPSFVSSANQAEGDSFYYFNPSVAPESARRRVRRIAKNRRTDEEAGEESLIEDDEGEEEEEAETDDNTHDEDYDEEEDLIPQAQLNPSHRDRGRPTRAEPELEGDVFGAEHSPSPSRAGSRAPSPNRKRESRLRESIGPFGRKEQARPLVGSGPGYGSISYTEGGISSSNVFERSRSGTRQEMGAAGEDTPYTDGALSPTTETPKTKNSGLGYRNRKPSQAHEDGQENLKVRRASVMESLKTPLKRDARQGSFAYANSGLRSNLGMTQVASPGGNDHAERARRMSMSLGIKDVKGNEVEVGRSTSGQTMFNAIAVLVGIGVLSEPLAFAYAGWIGGTVLLITFGFVTNYTAKLLAKIIMSDPNIQGYSDLGIKAFGWKARLWVDVLFCCELFALAIAWIVLLGDSLAVLLGHFSSDTWKIIGFFIVAPTTLLPLHLLSIPSLISLFSSLLLIIILLIDGFSKTAAPGSILHPVRTSLGPDLEGYNFLGGLGLLIAGFGGHAIIPSLAIDMKSPHKFNKVVNWAFFIASIIFIISGAAGYLMFGNNVSDAIIKDLLLPQYGFSIPLNQIATWMIVINPIAKFALCCRPLNLTVEAILGINSLPPPPAAAIADNKHLQLAQETQDPMESAYTITTGAFPAQATSEDAPADYVRLEKRKTVLRVVARAAVTAACVAVAICLPGFGRLMAFLGSFTTFCICVLLPLAFYTAIVPKEERGGLRDAIHLVIFLISLVMCVTGTAWAFFQTGE